MTMTAAAKGLVTKSRRNPKFAKAAFAAVRNLFAATMPAEQAKHATRAYFANFAG